ncbi:unnamed protein product [Merluccius merluccius]
MAGCRGLVTLALLCLWLCHNSLAKNDLPCQPSKRNSAFDTFQKRHVPSGAPHSVDQNVWEDYIRKHGCDRPTQSFLDPSDLERVKAVCSSQGGKRHKENLCISSQPFTFFTVRSEIGHLRDTQRQEGDEAPDPGLRVARQPVSARPL